MNTDASADQSDYGIDFEMRGKRSGTTDCRNRRDIEAIMTAGRRVKMTAAIRSGQPPGAIIAIAFKLISTPGLANRDCIRYAPSVMSRNRALPLLPNMP